MTLAEGRTLSYLYDVTGRVTEKGIAKASAAGAPSGAVECEEAP